MARSDHGPAPDTAPSGGWVFLAGATGRIGAVAAETFARQGADVVVHDSGRTPAAGLLAPKLSEQHQVRVLAETAEITDSGQLTGLRHRLEDRGVTALRALVVCTTAYAGTPVPVTALSAGEFRRVVETDLIGPFLLVRELLPLLSAHGAARVVLFSALGGLRGRTGAAHVCAAKAGVLGLTLALAKELEPHGVAVNSVAPGPVADPGDAPPWQLPDGVAVSTPQQVADIAAYLASGASSPLQGQTLVVNGGRSQQF